MRRSRIKIKQYMYKNNKIYQKNRHCETKLYSREWVKNSQFKI